MRLALCCVTLGLGVLAAFRVLSRQPEEALSTRRLMEQVLRKAAQKDRKVRPITMVRSHVSGSERKSA